MSLIFKMTLFKYKYIVLITVIKNISNLISIIFTFHNTCIDLRVFKIQVFIKFKNFKLQQLHKIKKRVFVFGCTLQVVLT